MKGINVTEELQDLLSVYMKAEDQLKQQEQHCLDVVTSCMKKYIEKSTERKKVSEKLERLKQKILAGHDVEEKQDEDEDE